MTPFSLEWYEAQYAKQGKALQDLGLYVGGHHEYCGDDDSPYWQCGACARCC